jgi:outer membrane DcaP-like protein
MKKLLFLIFIITFTIDVFSQESVKNDKNLSYEFSGFVNLNSICDFNGLDNYDDFTTSQIPINPSLYENTFRFHMTARQSRLNFGINYDTPWGLLVGFVAGDFYSGNTGNTSYFRLREAYLEIGNILLGQTNTTFGNPDVVPMTIDFEGPNSAPTLRNPMIKYSNKFSGNWSYSLALEMRGTDIQTFNKNDDPFLAIPGLVGNINKTGDWGVVTLSGMIDITRYFNIDSVQHHEFGYGGAVSAIINTWKENHFSIFLVTGSGIANYISDLSGLGYNGVPDFSTDKLVMLNSFGGFVAYTQNWTDKLSSNFIFSYIELEETSLLQNNDFRFSKYALANIIYVPFKRLTVGAEYIYGELIVQNNDNGNANRLQFLAQFNF